MSKDGEHYIDGELDDYLIVSVPTETPSKVVETIHKNLSEKFNQPVLVVTHNIEFVRAVRVKRKEREKVFGALTDRQKQVQEIREARESLREDESPDPLREEEE